MTNGSSLSKLRIAALATACLVFLYPSAESLAAGEGASADPRPSGAENHSLESFLFPLLYGFGDVVDSYDAFSADPTLKDDARALLETLEAGDVRGFLPDFENFMLKWAGADTVDPTSRGDNIDARHLVLLERLYGEPFRQFTSDVTEPDFQRSGGLGGYTGRPNAEAAAGLEELYRELIDRYATLFMAQSAISYAALYTGSLDYSAHPLAPLADMSFLRGATFLGGDFSSIATQIIDQTDQGALDPINAALVINLLTFDLLGEGADVEAAFAGVVSSYTGGQAAAQAILGALCESRSDIGPRKRSVCLAAAE